MFQSIMACINNSHPSGDCINACVMANITSYQNLGSC